MHPPSEEEDEPLLDDIVVEVCPRVPECHMEDDEVASTQFEYSTRAPNDWVVSGPMGNQGGGPGRRFANWSQAEKWAREKYAERFKGRILEAAKEGSNRWAFLIRAMLT